MPSTLIHVCPCIHLIISNFCIFSSDDNKEQSSFFIPETETSSAPEFWRENPSKNTTLSQRFIRHLQQEGCRNNTRSTAGPSLRGY